MDKLGTYDYNTINTGDAVEFLRTLPDGSVPMFLFSPPYNLGVTTGGGFTKLHYSENANMRARGGGGKVVGLVDRFFPSSKTCFDCGTIHKDLKLSDRQWACPGCGCIHDRDHNAALNIHCVGASTHGLGDVRPTLLAVAV